MDIVDPSFYPSIPGSMARILSRPMVIFLRAQWIRGYSSWRRLDGTAIGNEVRVLGRRTPMRRAIGMSKTTSVPASRRGRTGSLWRSTRRCSKSRGGGLIRTRCFCCALSPIIDVINFGRSDIVVEWVWNVGTAGFGSCFSSRDPEVENDASDEEKSGGSANRADNEKKVGRATERGQQLRSDDGQLSRVLLWLERSGDCIVDDDLLSWSRADDGDVMIRSSREGGVKVSLEKQQ